MISIFYHQQAKTALFVDWLTYDQKDTGSLLFDCITNEITSLVSYFLLAG